MPLMVIVCLILAGWMITGFYQVKTGERGVVQRFGRHVETVGDGWAGVCHGPSRPSPR